MGMEPYPGSSSAGDCGDHGACSWMAEGRGACGRGWSISRSSGGDRFARTGCSFHTWSEPSMAPEMSVDPLALTARAHTIVSWALGIS